jgi:uncharacterized SAM-binding protein YcdF (DUF218 family)
LRRKTVIATSAFAVIFALLALSGRFLALDSPAQADVIVALAGETERRPEVAVDLLRRGYAHQLVIDVPATAVIYQHTQLEIAQMYIDGLPEAAAIRICPIYGLSSKSESQDVARCLQGRGFRKVLLVTSDFHTRRALSIFRKMLPEYDFEIAAALDSRTFGVNWWEHREWAKATLLEWSKLIWWEVVDRW